ncbi:S8 family peptidase [Nocardioides pacificus]
MTLLRGARGARGARALASLLLGAGAVLAVGVPGVVVSGAVVPATAAEGDPVCPSDPNPVEGGPTDVDGPSAPLEQLSIDLAHEHATGKGISVAVLDTGVSSPHVEVVGEQPVTPDGGGPQILDTHGTQVAGLIAGRRKDGMGTAPGARIVSVKVLDGAAATVGDDAVQLTPRSVEQGLAWVADRVERSRGGNDIGVVNLSLWVDHSPGIEKQVRRLQKRGVIVVGAVGNRPTDEQDPLHGEFAEQDDDEDARLYPASYDGVIGVSTSVEPGEDPADVVLRSFSTDIAVPTRHAVTTVPDGSICVVEAPASSWAAAEVSGLVALLLERYEWKKDPRTVSKQVVARLLATADGADDVRSPYTGMGMARPAEALTRPLRFDDAGDVVATRDVAESEGIASPGRPAEDELVESRHDFLWWGVLAGAVLVLALLLKPLFARLRG